MSDEISNNTVTPQEVLSYVQDFIINFDLKPSEAADLFTSMVIMPLSKFYTIHDQIKQIALKYEDLSAASALQARVNKDTNAEWDNVSGLYGAIATGKMKLMFPQRPDYLQQVAEWGVQYKLMTELNCNEFSALLSWSAAQEIEKWGYDDWLHLAFGLEKIIPELREMVDIVDSIAGAQE